MSTTQAPHQVRLIFNPGAGARAQALRDEAVTRLEQAGMHVEYAETDEDGQPEDLARRAAGEGADLVVAMGGDWTIEAVARGLVGTPARLGIIPNGTANNVARSLGIPLTVPEACALLHEGYVRRIDVGELRPYGVPEASGRTFFEHAGFGLTAALFPNLKDVHKGNLQDLPQAVTTLMTYPRHTVELALDDEAPFTVDTLLVTVANAPVFGLTFLVAPLASLEDGRLDVSVYPGMSKAQLVSYFAAIAKGGAAPDESSLQRYRARQVRVCADPPLEAVADSRTLEPGNYVARLLPHALAVITPRETGLAQDPPARAGQKLESA